MINYLMIALISSAMVLNGSQEMIETVNSTPVQLPSVEQVKEALYTKGVKFVETVKTKSDLLVEKFNSGFAAQALEQAPEVTPDVVVAVKEVPASRFAKVFAKLKSIKNINIKEPVKNGFKYAFSLPVNGTKASVAWIKNNPKKSIALTVAAIGLGYASYALYNQYTAAQEEAELN